ncbi:uncharacterized protein LOC18436098 isoform X1 [Amborella trichopoda]|uniref:uncharacterized protein LOC18436098 isoform X1 n=1 Tax=Amborella trichopoda TaxID=13333 RepID=UPI0005D3320E|nr:uncharacterized protein LOC18436098 isoform X1 [Amborella trichopoda]|eukprot:XP_011624096.1 uncharacterized protein LOC18436098 isoform X1 [Amborella trichopoda]
MSSHEGFELPTMATPLNHETAAKHQSGRLLHQSPQSTENPNDDGGLMEAMMGEHGGGGEILSSLPEKQPDLSGAPGFSNEIQAGSQFHGEVDMGGGALVVCDTPAGKMEALSEKRANDLSAVSSPDWLPAGWITEIKVRANGLTAGTKDKYFYDPVSKRKFRSKKEVFSFLETGKLGRYKPKPKSDVAEAQSSEKETNPPSSSKVQRNKLGSSSPKKKGKFDFVNRPSSVKWVLEAEGQWLAFIDGQELPESSEAKNTEIPEPEVNAGKKLCLPWVSPSSEDALPGGSHLRNVARSFEGVTPNQVTPQIVANPKKAVQPPTITQGETKKRKRMNARPERDVLLLLGRNLCKQAVSDLKENKDPKYFEIQGKDFPLGNRSELIL